MEQELSVRFAVGLRNLGGCNTGISSFNSAREIEKYPRNRLVSRKLVLIGGQGLAIVASLCEFVKSRPHLLGYFLRQTLFLGAPSEWT